MPCKDRQHQNYANYFSMVFPVDFLHDLSGILGGSTAFVSTHNFLNKVTNFLDQAMCDSRGMVKKISLHKK